MGTHSARKRGVKKRYAFPKKEDPLLLQKISGKRKCRSRPGKGEKNCVGDEKKGGGVFCMKSVEGRGGERGTFPLYQGSCERGGDVAYNKRKTYRQCQRKKIHAKVRKKAPEDSRKKNSEKKEKNFPSGWGTSTIFPLEGGGGIHLDNRARQKGFRSKRKNRSSSDGEISPQKWALPRDPGGRKT